jgi:DNA repair protein SbcD/Mre11
MPIRFIHAADVHLDSALSGLSSCPEAPLDMLRTAPRRAFESLIDEAITGQVDFVVIAGDLYDGTWKDFNTGLFFAAQMGRLRGANIRVVVLHGNHDAESDLSPSLRLRLPDNVHVFGSRKAETIKFDDLRVAIHGQSFRQRAVSENLVKQYPERVSGWLNIGVLHTALGGREGHEPYAPCNLDDLRGRGYQYWALGHAHEYEIVCECPWVVFPGNLQGRNVRETGARGAMLVEADGDAIVSVSRLVEDVLRWEDIRVDVQGCATANEAIARAEARFVTALDMAGGRPIAARVTLFGRTTAHGELFGAESRVRAELQAAALAHGAERLWIEKLRLATEPAWSAAEIEARGDAVADLHVMLEQAPGDADLLRALEEELAEMISKLEPEVRTASDPMLSAARENRLGDIIREIAPALVARVAGD